MHASGHILLRDLTCVHKSSCMHFVYPRPHATPNLSMLYTLCVTLKNWEWPGDEATQSAHEVKAKSCVHMHSWFLAQYTISSKCILTYT